MTVFVLNSGQFFSVKDSLQQKQNKVAQDDADYYYNARLNS